MKRFYFILLLASALQVMGCGGLSKELQWTDLKDHCMVYGFVDAHYSWCDFVDLKFPGENYSFRVDKGLVYSEGLVPGHSYRVSAFGGGRTEFHLPIQDSGFYGGDPGSVEGIGYFKFTKKNGNTYVERFQGNKIKMLELLLPHAKGSPWEPNIKKELKRLKIREAKTGLNG